MSYIDELVGPIKPYVTRSQRDADAERTLVATHKRYASELRAALDGRPSPSTPNAPCLTPAQARALAEQVVAGQCSATPGEMAVAKAWLATTKA